MVPAARGRDALTDVAVGRACPWSARQHKWYHPGARRSPKGALTVGDHHRLGTSRSAAWATRSGLSSVVHVRLVAMVVSSAMVKGGSARVGALPFSAGAFHSAMAQR